MAFCRSTIAGSSGSTPTWPAGRTLIKGNTQLLFGGMGRLTENVLVNVKNKSHSVTAEVVAPEAGATGVIMAQGGALRRLVRCTRTRASRAYCYNLFGLQRFKIYGEHRRSRRARTRCASSSHTTAAVSAKGGGVALFIDGTKVGEGRVDGTEPMAFSGDETADVGRDTASPVSDDYKGVESIFNGTVNWVQIDIDEAAEDLDHLITPEEPVRDRDGSSVGRSRFSFREVRGRSRATS